jgi:hypothetical protein
MRPATMFILLTLSAAGLPGEADAGEWRGPTVFIAPGDVTPLRGNIINPLGPSQVYGPLRPLPRPGVEALERDLRRELDRLPSRPPEGREPADPGPRLQITEEPLGRRALPAIQDRIDRARAAAALEAFKTLRPNAPSTPIMERELDRIERPTGLGQ